MLSGKTALGPVTQGALMGMAAVMAIPSLMVFLSLILPAAASRWLNILFGAAYTVIMVLAIQGKLALLCVLRTDRNRSHPRNRLVCLDLAKTICVLGTKIPVKFQNGSTETIQSTYKLPMSFSPLVKMDSELEEEAQKQKPRSSWKHPGHSYLSKSFRFKILIRNQFIFNILPVENEISH